MAKVRPAAYISSISGKLAQGEPTYYATNRHTGRTYAVYVKNPYRGPWSERQTAHRDNFRLRSKTASAWLAANDPKRNGGTETEEYKAMMRKYNKQTKIGNVFAFVAKHYDNGTIKPFTRK